MLHKQYHIFAEYNVSNFFSAYKTIKIQVQNSAKKYLIIRRMLKLDDTLRVVCDDEDVTEMFLRY